MAPIYANGSKIKQFSVKFCVKTSWLSIYLIYNLLSRFYVRVCDEKSLTHKNAFHFDFLLSSRSKLDGVDMLAIFKLNSLRKKRSKLLILHVSLHNLRFLPNNHFIFIDSSVARYFWSSFTIGRAKAGTSGNTEDDPRHSHGGFCVPCIEIWFKQQKNLHLSISPSFEISGIFIHLRIGRNKSQFSA